MNRSHHIGHKEVIMVKIGYNPILSVNPGILFGQEDKQ